MSTIMSMKTVFEAMFYVILIITYFFASVAFELFAVTEAAATATPASAIQQAGGGAIAISNSTAHSIGSASLGNGAVHLGAAVAETVDDALGCGDWCPGFNSFGLSLLTYFQIMVIADWSTVSKSAST